MRKRFSALLLALVLTVGLLPTTAWAADSWGGTGLAEICWWDSGFYAEGNNIIVTAGTAEGKTNLYYADAGGTASGSAINLSAIQNSSVSGDTSAGFDLSQVGLYATHNSTYNNNKDAFNGLDVVISMQGGSLKCIGAGNSNAMPNSVTVNMSGGSLTGCYNGSDAIGAHTINLSGGRIDKSLNGDLKIYVSGSPQVGGTGGDGIRLSSGKTFSIQGALSGASVYVNPQAAFADGTIIAKADGSYTITQNDVTQLHLTGSYVDNKELYLDGNQVKIRTKQVPAHSHPICGASCSHTESHGNVTWTGLSAAPADNGLNGGNYYLTENIAINTQITISGEVNLCLNGHKIENSAGHGISVNSGATLNLCDCTGGGAVIGDSSTGAQSNYGILNNGTVNVYDGSVEGKITHGINNNGTLNVYGGAITGNTRGINNSSKGTLNVYGGDLTGTEDYGIFHGGVSFTLGGSPNITGGKAGICLNNKTVTVQPGLEGSYSVGLLNPTTATYPVAITTAASADYSGRFTSADASYAIRNSGTGDAQVVQLCEPHSHAWATAWSKNATHHWHDCTADGCDVTENSGKDGYAEHTPGDWITDQEATTEAAGSKHKACSVCSYTTETVTIPKLEPSHTHPVCGAACSGHEGSHENVTWTAWNGTGNLTAGNYYLSEDVTRSSTLTISGTVNLCLNGHVIKKTGNSRVITVSTGATLNICDCDTTTVHKFSVDSATGLWTLDEDSGTETVTGGVITGGIASGSSNTPTIEGGGVLVNGTFCLHGGSIIGNTVQKTTAGGDQYGGGVSVNNGGVFTMTGGAITGNVSQKAYAGGFVFGGGVSVINGSFTMSGGTISSNRCTNSAGGSFQRGGGVYSTGTFTMTGGTISGNTADDGGGGVFSGGTFTMTGGTITGNSSKSGGGGVRISGPSFTLSGSPTITGNKNGSADNNVYLDKYSVGSDPEGMPLPPDELEDFNRFITVGEDFTPSEKIGVTTAIKPTCGKPTDITGANDKDYAQYFTSESEGCTVRNSGTNVVQLAKPHALTKTSAKAATCTETGKKEYWTCSDCKKLFSDAAGTTETTEADLTIAARNHNYTYAASGGCITGTCQNDSSHTHTATLTAANATYDGAAKETGRVTYSEGWPDKNLTITYSGNSGVGTATASITYNGATAEVNFTITAASQDAPSANEGYTIDYASETLTLGSGYEASTSENFADKLNSGAKIQPGTTLYIRKAAVTGTDPSPAAANTVPARPTQPSGVNAVEPTAAGADDGKITGVSTDMEYSPDGTAWTPCPGTEVTGLAAGSYQVRVKATGSAFAGETVTVTVGAGHTHNWATTWTTSTTHHWHECEGTGTCDQGGKNDYGEHTPGDWIVNQAATTEAAGSKHKACTVCGYTTETETIPKLEPSHTHAWATAWTTSETHHWHECVGAGTCDITANAGKNSYGTHTWNAGEVTKEPTATAEGVKTYTCTICAAAKTEPVPIPTFNISGKVTDSEDKAVVGATVKLMRGSTQVASTTTADGGNYSFANVTPGSYNVVAEQTQDGSAKTITILVTVTDANQTERNLKMPRDSVNSVLDVKDSSVDGAAAEVSKSVVGGLEAEAQAQADADETEIEANESKLVTVEMSVEAKTEADNASDIQNAAVGKTLDYLEIKVEKKVEIKKEGVVTREQRNPISTTKNLLTIVIPFDFTGKVQSSVAVYRYHNGSVDTLTTTASGGGERIVLGADSITLYVRNFSTYAIGYTESAAVNYTVTFDSQGGSAVASQTVAQNGKVTRPANPTKSGYSFGGWYKEAACVTAWDFSADTVTDSVTLYAKWTAPGGSSTGGGGGGSYSSAVYPINISGGIPNGAVSVSPSSAGKGNTVTITVTPDEGYEISSVTVINRDGKEVPVTGKGNGRYTFTMPEGNVTVNAYFTKISESRAGCPKDDTCPIWSYADASVTAWYHDGVHYCIENGLMSGYDDNTFRPGDDTSRAMIATILWRLEGSPVVNDVLPFDDVAEGVWYTEAIRWAAASGVAGGYENGKFGPGDPITREQLAAMLYRYEQYKGGGFTGEWEFPLNYTDAELVSSWAFEPMCWTTMNGIIDGIGNDLLDPKGKVTRAQAATMIMRFCEKK